jgi:hypothetical protein
MQDTRAIVNVRRRQNIYVRDAWMRGKRGGFVIAKQDEIVLLCTWKLITMVSNQIKLMVFVVLCAL